MPGGGPSSLPGGEGLVGGSPLPIGERCPSLSVCLCGLRARGARAGRPSGFLILGPQLPHWGGNHGGDLGSGRLRGLVAGAAQRFIGISIILRRSAFGVFGKGPSLILAVLFCLGRSRGKNACIVLYANEVVSVGGYRSFASGHLWFG